MSKNIKKLEDLVDFLDYFYETADYAFGPASGEIYKSIQDEYEHKTGKVVPSLYRIEEEEEEEEEEEWQ